MEEKNLKFIYLFKDKLKDNYIIEAKRLDLPKTTPKKDRYFWFWILSMRDIYNMSYKDSGKLYSGKEIRILENKSMDTTFILIFDHETLDIYRNNQVCSGDYKAIAKDKISKQDILF